MRVREDFTVYPRRLKSGRVVYNYQTYDEEGNRTNGHSTGETIRSMAIKKCNALMREGKLIPSRQKRIPTFAEFAAGWWEKGTCLYLKKRDSRKKITDDYIHQSKRIMDTFLIPYFGKMRLDKITDEIIDVWLVEFLEREKRQLRGKKAKAGEKQEEQKLKASYANMVFGILRLMLKEAVKRRLIPFNPAENVDRLSEKRKRVQILSINEFQQLVTSSKKEITSGEETAVAAIDYQLEMAKTANILAACTGMRIGEVLGLRGEFVYADSIKVNGQYGQHGYGETKTREPRIIPLSPVILDGLRRIAEINGNGYLFSTDGGAKPISRYFFNKYLKIGLAEIGIDKDEKKRRNLTPHAWRHFLNTSLRAKGVADAKVQAITGHKTQDSTERYTQFRTEEFTEVRDIQNTLLLTDNTMANADTGLNTDTRTNAARLFVPKGFNTPPLGAVKKY
jgi:integrase